jgi:8-oxo-dGTP pyrophosphatase MutT (NUDIX family)
MDSYKRLAHRSVYRNPWVEVEVHDVVHPTGAQGEHVLIVTPPAVGVVVEDGEELVFTSQPRFGAGRRFIEIVKGGADDDDEAPIEAARRELQEELGLVAASWESIGEVYEIPSIVANPVTLFVARDLTRVAPAPEEIEQIAEERLTVADALDRAVRGELNDAVTLAALLRYSRGTRARSIQR